MRAEINTGLRFLKYQVTNTPTEHVLEKREIRTLTRQV